MKESGQGRTWREKTKKKKKKCSNEKGKKSATSWTIPVTLVNVLVLMRTPIRSLFHSSCLVPEMQANGHEVNPG